MVTRIKAIIALLILLSFPVVGFSSEKKSIPSLQKILDSVIDDDEQIKLVEGKSFLDKPGSVIFLSREMGKERMIELARSDQAELSILFIPKWEVWITQTTFRSVDQVKFDKRYIIAALACDVVVENWHTHNNISSGVVDEETSKRRSIQWTMPSPNDLLQCYDYARDMPGAKYYGVIASIHGITTYWNHDPLWATPTYVRYAVRTEADIFWRETAKLTLEELPQYAKNHQGFVNLRFEPVSK